MRDRRLQDRAGWGITRTMEIVPVQFPTSRSLLRMTFPALAEALTSSKAAERFFGFEYCEAGQTLGLGLAQIASGDSAANIVSLFVTPNRWNKGIGSGLLAALETEARERTIKRIEANYSTEHPIHAALERVLEKGGWSQPVLKMRQARLSAASMQDSWILKLEVPLEFRVFPWTELTEMDRTQLKEIEPTVPHSLRPSNEREAFEPCNSLGLRRGSELVGWLMTHRVAPKNIRYTILFVRPEWRTSKLSFALLAEGMRRQIASIGADSFGSFAVLAENLSMLRVADRKLRPFAVAYHDLRGASKTLQ